METLSVQIIDASDIPEDILYDGFPDGGSNGTLQWYHYRPKHRVPNALDNYLDQYNLPSGQRILVEWDW